VPNTGTGLLTVKQAFDAGYNNICVRETVTETEKITLQTAGQKLNIHIMEGAEIRYNNGTEPFIVVNSTSVADVIVDGNGTWCYVGPDTTFAKFVGGVGPKRFVVKDITMKWTATNATNTLDLKFTTPPEYMVVQNVKFDFEITGTATLSQTIGYDDGGVTDIDDIGYLSVSNCRFPTSDLHILNLKAYHVHAHNFRHGGVRVNNPDLTLHGIYIFQCVDAMVHNIFTTGRFAFNGVGVDNAGLRRKSLRTLKMDNCKIGYNVEVNVGGLMDTDNTLPQRVLTGHIRGCQIGKGFTGNVDARVGIFGSWVDSVAEENFGQATYKLDRLEAFQIASNNIAGFISFSRFHAYYRTSITDNKIEPLNQQYAIRVTGYGANQNNVPNGRRTEIHQFSIAHNQIGVPLAIADGIGQILFERRFSKFGLTGLNIKDNNWMSNGLASSSSPNVVTPSIQIEHDWATLVPETPSDDEAQPAMRRCDIVGNSLHHKFERSAIASHIYIKDWSLESCHIDRNHLSGFRLEHTYIYFAQFPSIQFNGRVVNTTFNGNNFINETPLSANQQPVFGLKIFRFNTAGTTQNKIKIKNTTFNDNVFNKRFIEDGISLQPTLDKAIHFGQNTEVKYCTFTGNASSREAGVVIIKDRAELIMFETNDVQSCHIFNNILHPYIDETFVLNPQRNLLTREQRCILSGNLQPAPTDAWDINETNYFFSVGVELANVSRNKSDF
jgi:hypothetical protein